MPQHLPLLDQMDFTDGGCSAFAVATLRRWPEAQLQILIVDDPRYLETQGWPASEPMCVHAFVRHPDGWVIDAEGRRTLTQLARSFGVKRGYSHRVLDVDVQGLSTHLPFHEGVILDALVQMTLHGWGPDVPEASGAVGKAWTATRRLQNQRGCRPEPSGEDLVRLPLHERDPKLADEWRALLVEMRAAVSPSDHLAVSTASPSPNP